MFQRQKIIPGVVKIMYKHQYFWAGACFKVKRLFCLALYTFDVLKSRSFDRLDICLRFLLRRDALQRWTRRKQEWHFSLRTARQNSTKTQKQKSTEIQMMQNKNPDLHWKWKTKQRTFLRNSSATIRARALTESFISLISLSISSIKWMTKSTNLCLYICSVWKLVMRKLIS